MDLRLSRTDRIVLAALLLFALFFRLATLMMIHTGIDERDYWFSAKTIAHGLPYPDLSHRTTRFAVILPVAAIQVLAGSHPDLYYLMPVLNSVLQAGLAFVIALKLRGRLAGFLAALALTLFPYMIRAGSQVRPEIFSLTYVLLALFFFLRYLERDRREIAPLLWTAVWLFVAYEAKVTNAYFLPGLVLAIVIFKRKPGHAAILCGVILALFAVETAAYAALTPYKLGEFEIIFKYHIEEGTPLHLQSLTGLFMRYAPSNLQAYWSLPFALFAAAAAYYLIRGGNPRVAALVCAALSFFVGITFEVAGLHPITPAEPFINRYFTAVLAPVFVVLACAVQELLRGSRRLNRSGPSDPARGWVVTLCAGAVAVLALFSLPRLPAGIRPWVNSPLHPGRHPLVLNERYRQAINGALGEGVPLVSVTGIGGQNAMETARAYFIDLSRYVDGRPPAAQPIQRDGQSYLAVGWPAGSRGPAAVLALVRTPFRVSRMAAADLGRLSDDAFTGGSRSNQEEPR